MRVVTLFVVVLTVLLASPAVSQQDSAAKPSGAYTTAQADRGVDVYRTGCSACHLAKDHYSPDFQQNWNGRTVRSLYDYIRSTMPDDNPGTLSEQQYLDVTAYILKLNGMPAGTVALSSDTTALKKLVIDVKKPGALPR